MIPGHSQLAQKKLGMYPILKFKACAYFTCPYSKLTVLFFYLQRDDAQLAPFYAVLCNWSTDSAVIEQEMVYMRYAKQGVVKVCFISLQSVDRGTALNIKAAIDAGIGTIIDSNWKNQVVPLGSDEAWDMTGQKGSVIAFLRSECQWLQVSIQVAFKSAPKKPNFEASCSRAKLEVNDWLQYIICTVVSCKPTEDKEVIRYINSHHKDDQLPVLD